MQPTIPESSLFYKALFYVSFQQTNEKLVSSVTGKFFIKNKVGMVKVRFLFVRDGGVLGPCAITFTLN